MNCQDCGRPLHEYAIFDGGAPHAECRAAGCLLRFGTFPVSEFPLTDAAAEQVRAANRRILASRFKVAQE